MRKETKTKLDKLAGALKAIKAKDIMTTNVVTTKEDATLEEVANEMVKKRISGMPVIGKRGNVVGVISKIDLFIVMDMIGSGDVLEEEAKGRFNPTVKFAMSAQVAKVNRNTPLDEIIAVVKYHNIHTLPVFEGKKMVGVIGRHDIFKNFYNAVHRIL